MNQMRKTNPGQDFALNSHILPKIMRTSPYFFEEIFYEFGDVDALIRNESGVGMMIPFFKAARLDLEFRFQNNKNGGAWKAANIHFFTKLKYNL